MKDMTSKSFIFDTSVIIDDLRTKCHSERIASLTEDVYLSAVVLAELWRGARSRFDLEFLIDIQKSHPILTPSETIWIDSGIVLAELKKTKGFEANKLRDLHFDVLIALTAKANDLCLITANRDDFEMIRKLRAFEMQIW